MSFLSLEQLETRAAHDARARAPELPLRWLDTLWVQVTGTLCNLTCRHCFITCGPNNDSHPFMSRAQVEQAVEDALKVGLREVYFTGGEPFLHPDIVALIRFVLDRAPLSILTNGVLIDQSLARELKTIFDASAYSLDLRVSLDGTTPEQNDPIRGRGTFEQIMSGVRALADAGLNPVLTITEVDEYAGDPGYREAFRNLLADAGLTRPRLKFLAPFRIGREAYRGRGYDEHELLQEGDLLEGEAEALQCSSCRMVTAKGWYPCPILIEQDEARMGDSLSEAMRTIRLDHPACYTCHVEGVSCRT